MNDFTHSDGRVSHDARAPNAIAGDGAVAELTTKDEAPRRRSSRTRGQLGSDLPALAAALAADQAHRDTHSESVGGDPIQIDGGHTCSDALDTVAAVGEGHSHGDAQLCCAFAPILAELREQHRQRQLLHRNEKGQTLAIKALARRLCDGDKDEAEVLYKAAIKGKGEHVHAATLLGAALPFVACRDTLKKARMAKEKRMVALATSLPVWQWAEPIRGFGALGLAMIIGECGDLSIYANPAKIWKRMGLAVFDGKAQGRREGAEGIRQGYSPSRRAIMFVLGEAMIKQNTGEYKALYDARKAYEVARDDEIKPILAHRRALRYLEKRLLKHLWQAWRASHDAASVALVPAEISSDGGLSKAETRMGYAPTDDSQPTDISMPSAVGLSAGNNSSQDEGGTAHLLAPESAASRSLSPRRKRGRPAEGAMASTSGMPGAAS